MLEKFYKVKQSGLRILDIKDISIILDIGLPSARVIATRMVRKKILIRLKRNLYLLNGADINDFEVANKLVVPSYISFESALNYWGITTQIPFPVTSAAMRSKRIIIGNKEFLFSNIPRQLFNAGIIKEKTFFIASPEKALLDTIYYSTLGKKSISFDVLNVKKVSKTKLNIYLRHYPRKTKELTKELIK